MGAVAAFIIFGGPATLSGPARAGDIVASNGGAAGITGFRIQHYPGGARDVGASSHEVGAS